MELSIELGEETTGGRLDNVKGRQLNTFGISSFQGVRLIVWWSRSQVLGKPRESSPLAGGRIVGGRVILYARPETTINQLDADRVVRLRLSLRGYSGPPHSLAFTKSALSACLSWFSVLPPINLF